MAQGKGYQGPRRRGHATSYAALGSGGGDGYAGPSWDQYAKKKKKKPAGGGGAGGSSAQTEQIASAALGYMTA